MRALSPALDWCPNAGMGEFHGGAGDIVGLRAGSCGANGVGVRGQGGQG